MSKKRILIVEDEALTVLALKHELPSSDTKLPATQAQLPTRSTLPKKIARSCAHGHSIGWRDQRGAAAAAIRGHLDIPDCLFLTAHASAETVGRESNQARSAIC